MKKWTAALVTLAVGVSALALPASAAEATFVDTLEDNYPLVYEISEWMRYQKNTDLGLNTYLKCKPEGEGYEEYDTHPEKAPLREEYVVYKMDGDVTGYTIDCIHVNGLGNAETDVSVYLSKDGTNWVEADSAFSEQTYDDEIYINLEKAYWLNSTVSNAAKCPAGYNYIKITLNPFTVKDSCTWNTALTGIKITYEKAGGDTPTTDDTTTAAPDTTTGNSDTTTTASAPEGGTAPSTSTTTTAAATTKANDSSVPADTDADEDGSMVGVIIGIVAAVVVLAGAGVGVYFFLKKKKMNEGK